jgi:hypothetical protein
MGSSGEIFIVTTSGQVSSLPVIVDDYLDCLREFIDFINIQSGVYMDAVAGFSGNRVRMELQVARVQRRFKKGKDIDGADLVVSTSLEEPSRPDVIIQRISKVDSYISTNSPSGFNEQQQAWGIIIFVFSLWDEEIRPRLARAKGVSSSEIIVDAMGDLRLVRHAILHNKGRLTVANYKKLRALKDLFAPDAKISISYDAMHQIFIRSKQGIGGLIVEHVGARPGSPMPSDIKDVAISRGNLGRGAVADDDGKSS